MDKQQIIARLRALLADLEQVGGTQPAVVEPSRPSGGDGWQRALATFWSCEMKQTMKGEALRGRLGVSWKEPDGQVVKKFYSVFDEKLCEKIEQVIEKGQPIKVKLKPWKDTEIVVDFEMGRA
jgi:hypothetical protein